MYKMLLKAKQLADPAGWVHCRHLFLPGKGLAWMGPKCWEPCKHFLFVFLDGGVNSMGLPGRQSSWKRLWGPEFLL